MVSVAVAEWVAAPIGADDKVALSMAVERRSNVIQRASPAYPPAFARVAADQLVLSLIRQMPTEGCGTTEPNVDV